MLPHDSGGLRHVADAGGPEQIVGEPQGPLHHPQILVLPGILDLGLLRGVRVVQIGLLVGGEELLRSIALDNGGHKFPALLIGHMLPHPALGVQRHDEQGGRPAADLLQRAARALLPLPQQWQPGGNVDALLPQQGHRAVPALYVLRERVLGPAPRDGDL